jgi:hypothetical protein
VLDQSRPACFHKHVHSIIIWKTMLVQNLKNLLPSAYVRRRVIYFIVQIFWGFSVYNQWKVLSQIFTKGKEIKGGMTFLPWKWRQQVPPKCWHPSTKLHTETQGSPLYTKKLATGHHLGPLQPRSQLQNVSDNIHFLCYPRKYLFHLPSILKGAEFFPQPTFCAHFLPK